MVEVRRPRPEEIPSLYTIECATFEEDMRWDESDFIDVLNSSQVWVIDYIEDGCECGQVWNCICNDTPKETRTTVGLIAATINRGEGYILSFSVLPEHQHKGFGAKLLTAAEEHFKQTGTKVMRLDVHPDNPAQTLYFRMGYRVTYIRKKYYENGEPCLVMRKCLDILARMNTPFASRAMKAAFNASPQELRQAAVRQAKRL